MVASVQNPEDIINLSLVRIGYPGRVDNIYDGSPQANAALTIYAQTRDELLREQDWGFAERNVSMELLKSAPSGGYIPPQTWNPTDYPPLPWSYSYTYPSDCLKVRALKPTPLFIADFDPQPILFRIVNDNGYTVPQQVIVTNLAEAILTYTGQVTNMQTWEPLFVEALAASLGQRLALGLANIQTKQVEMVDENRETAVAAVTRG